MLSAEEIQRSLGGAWLLFKGRDEGMRAFDTSIDGFWRSFRVILLMLPVYFIILAGQRDVILSTPEINTGGFSDGTFFTLNMIGALVDWVAYPIVIALIAGPLGLSGRYIGFIVARNWTSFIALLPYAILMSLSLVGVLSGVLLSLLMLVALGVVLRYRFVTTRAALGTPLSLTIGLVVLDFVLSLVLSLSIDRLIGFG